MIERPAKGTYSDTFAYEPTTVRERASAAGVAAALVAAPLLVAPFARLQSGPVPTFVATVETVVIVAAIFTATMLYAQFRMQRYAPLAILSAGYALLGVLNAAYLLTFPGAFSPNGLLGAGPETAPWLGAAARVGFALVIMAYAYVESRPRAARWKTGMAARICAACAAYVVVCVSFATLGHAWLPAFIGTQERIGFAGSFTLGIVFVACACAAAALAAYCGSGRRVHLWLTVVMIAMAVEVPAAALLGGARFTLGWYLAQIDLTIGATLFFVVMQSLLASILRRAARNGERAHALAEIVALGNDGSDDRNSRMLERAARDLQFSWAYLAALDEDDWITLECSMGDTRYPVGYRAPLAHPGVRATLGDGLVAYAPNAELPWIDDTPGGLRRWSSYVTVPIFVEGVLYGFAGFASIAKRDSQLSDQDRSFLKLVGSLAGATLERLRQRRKLDDLAFHDSLTGLPNRVLLLDRLKQILATATRYDRPFAIHYLDLDGFKEVNDRYGHAAGDAVLREVALRLQSVVRESDTVARIGGDEFVVVQPQLEHPKDADRLAARLRTAFEEPIGYERRQLAIGTSIGTSRYPRDGREISALMSRADAALYRVKDRKHKAASPSDVTFVDRLGY